VRTVRVSPEVKENEPVYETFAKARKGLLQQLEQELQTDFGPGVISKTTVDTDRADTLIFRLPTGRFGFRVHKPHVERWQRSGVNVSIMLLARWAALEALFLPTVSQAECVEIPIGNGPFSPGEALFGWSQPDETTHHWSLNRVSASTVVRSTAELARSWRAFIEGDPSVAAAHFLVLAGRKTTGLPVAPKFPRSNGPSTRIGPPELVAIGQLLLAGNRQAAAATLAEFEADPRNKNLAENNSIYFHRTGPERAALVEALHQRLGQ
jgi:hypothetical protein